jgi:hypothetical protein
MGIHDMVHGCQGFVATFGNQCAAGMLDGPVPLGCCPGFGCDVILM